MDMMTLVSTVSGQSNGQMFAILPIFGKRFKRKEALNKFTESGWEFGGHADAAAKAGQSGGQLSGQGAIGSDIEAYSMTESELALQATVAGTKYWKDKDLN